MEISPIPGIRALQPERTPSVDAKLPANFAIDASAKPGDDRGSKNGKKAAGAEEAEEDDLMMEGEIEAGSETLEDVPPKSINYFA